MGEEDMPMDVNHGPMHFTEGTLAYAGMHLHVDGHPAHTHRFDRRMARLYVALLVLLVVSGAVACWSSFAS